jgi:hypothetical protein
VEGTDKLINILVEKTQQKMPLILTIKRLPWFSQSKSKERIPEYEN